MIALEFFKSSIQLHTSLHFLPIEVVCYLTFLSRGLYRGNSLVLKFNLMYHNSAPVAGILNFNLEKGVFSLVKKTSVFPNHFFYL